MLWKKFLISVIFQGSHQDSILLIRLQLTLYSMIKSPLILNFAMVSQHLMPLLDNHSALNLSLQQLMVNNRHSKDQEIQDTSWVFLFLSLREWIMEYNKLIRMDSNFSHLMQTDSVFQLLNKSIQLIIMFNLSTLDKILY